MLPSQNISNLKSSPSNARTPTIIRNPMITIVGNGFVRRLSKRFVTLRDL